MKRTRPQHRTVKCQWSTIEISTHEKWSGLFFAKRLNVNHYSLRLNCNYQLLIQQTQHVNPKLNFASAAQVSHFSHCVKLFTFWLSAFFIANEIVCLITARATNHHRRLISFNLFILIIFCRRCVVTHSGWGIIICINQSLACHHN